MEAITKPRSVDLSMRALLLEGVTLTIPLSQFRDFEEAWNVMNSPDKPKNWLRYGQAFHTFAGLNKITSEPNRTWCDIVHELDEPYAKALIRSRVDYGN